MAGHLKHKINLGERSHRGFALHIVCSFLVYTFGITSNRTQMASQQNDASPPAPSRCARAERLLASIDSRVDRDTVKIVKQHLRACMLKYEREGVPTPPDDPVLAAFDAFGTTGGGDEAALLGALETYVHTVLGRSEDVGIGSPLVVSASLHSLLENAGLDDHDVGSMRPASPARRITVNADGQGHARLTGRLARLGSASLADLFSPSHMPIPVHLVYFAEEMRSVALELAAHTDAVVLREIDWGSFPDGFPNLRVNHAKDLRFNSVLFLASIHSPASLLSQISIIYALPGYGAKRVKVIIPWFATGTMERESVRGEVATAKTLARLLSATPLSATGPVQFSILDIHALQEQVRERARREHTPACGLCVIRLARALCGNASSVCSSAAAYDTSCVVHLYLLDLSIVPLHYEQFYFADTVQIRLKSCIGLLQDALMLQPDVGEISIVFPDEGAMKRFGGKLLT